MQIQLYKTFLSDDFIDSWWCDFNPSKDRLTGKWKMIDDDVFIEVEHRFQSGLFRKKWVTETEWYGSKDVRFVQEFNCNT